MNSVGIVTKWWYMLFIITCETGQYSLSLCLNMRANYRISIPKRTERNLLLLIFVWVKRVMWLDLTSVG